jgi:hypothetical protein
LDGLMVLGMDKVSVPSLLARSGQEFNRAE